MSSRAAPRESNINIRVRSVDRDLIDRAAEVSGKSRSEFLIETGRREAEAVLREQLGFHLESSAWKSFVAALDKPPRNNPKLRALLARRAPWEK